MMVQWAYLPKPINQFYLFCRLTVSCEKKFSFQNFSILHILNYSHVVCYVHIYRLQYTCTLCIESEMCCAAVYSTVCTESHVLLKARNAVEYFKQSYSNKLNKI